MSFRSSLVPPLLRRSKSVEELLPLLYLKGVSSGDSSEAFSALLGPDAAGLSAKTISRLMSKWLQDLEKWRRRDLSQRRYVYIWSDGVYTHVRSDDARLCLLVLIGARADGKKDLVAVADGYRVSEQSWWELLRDLRARGLSNGVRKDMVAAEQVHRLTSQLLPPEEGCGDTELAEPPHAPLHRQSA